MASQFDPAQIYPPMPHRTPPCAARCRPVFTAGAGILALFAAALFAPLTRADQSVWKQAFDAAWSDAQAAEAAGKWDDAVVAYERVKKLVPYECLTRYNLARCLTRAERYRDALIALAEAVEYGWCDGIAIVNEPAFAPLRTDSDFARAVRRAAEIADERLIPYVPANIDKTKPAPVIIALHGRGETPQGFLPYWRGVADDAGAILIVPRGPVQLGNCIANAWDRKDTATAPDNDAKKSGTSQPAGNPASTPTTRPAASQPTSAATAASAPTPAPEDIDIIAARRAVNVSIAFAHQFGQVDEQQIVLAGFSQGGAAALRVLADSPERFAGAITLGALYYAADAAAWENAAQKRPLRVVLYAGALDRLKSHSEKAAADLRAAHIETKLEILPAVGHEPPPDWLERQKAALRFVLKRD